MHNLNDLFKSIFSGIKNSDKRINLKINNINEKLQEFGIELDARGLPVPRTSEYGKSKMLNIGPTGKWLIGDDFPKVSSSRYRDVLCSGKEGMEWTNIGLIYKISNVYKDSNEGYTIESVVSGSGLSGIKITFANKVRKAAIRFSSTLPKILVSTPSSTINSIFPENVCDMILFDQYAYDSCMVSSSSWYPNYGVEPSPTYSYDISSSDGFRIVYIHSYSKTYDLASKIHDIRCLYSM